MIKSKLLFLCILLTGFSVSRAQIVERDSTGAAIPYPLTEITPNLQRTSTLIDEATAFHDDREVLDEVQKEIFSLDSLLQITIDKIDTTTNSNPQIRTYQAELNGYMQRIESLENRLNDRTSKLSEYRDQVKDAIDVWTVTLSGIKEDNSSSAAQNNIQEMLTRLRSVNDLIVKQIDVVFRSQGGITDRKARIQQNLDMLSSFQSKISERIFRVDSSPIWEIQRDSASFSRFVTQIKENGSASIESSRAYVKQNTDLIFINALTIVLLMVLIIFLKMKQEKLIHYHDQKELWVMLKHPIGLAILLGLLVFSPPYKLFPEALGDVLLLIVYTIVTYILFPVVRRNTKIFLLVLGLFLLLNTVLSFVSQYGIVARFIQLIEAFAGIYFIYAIIRPGLNSYNYFNTPMAKWIANVLPIGFITFGISIVANLLGATRFTEYLLYASTKSMALGILVFTGVMVLNGMILILLRSPKAKTMHLLKEHSEVLENRTKQLLQLGMFGFFLILVLKEFQIWDDVQTWFNVILDYDIGYGERSITIRSIFAFIITIVASWWIAKVLKLVLEKELFRRMNLPRGIPGAISTSMYYFIIVLGFFLALSQSGVDLNQISIIVGALGVGIGFGLQNIISNFISGIILAFERPVQEGDTVEVGTLMGDVKSIGIRSSKVRTYDGSEVIVPNSNLISNEVINWTLSDRQRRSTIEVGVAYGTAPRRVAEILQKVAEEYPKTLKNPAPLVVFKGFGASSLDFKLHFWTTFDDGYTSKSEVAMNVYDALEQEGIEIPFPQRVVTMKEPDKATSKDVKDVKETKETSEEEPKRNIENTQDDGD